MLPALDVGAAVPSRFGAVRRRSLLFAMLMMLVLAVFVAMFEARFAPAGGEAAGIGAARSAAVAPRLGGRVNWPLGAALVAAGVIVGFFMGMLGMGGGVFKIACMLIVFEMDVFFARAVSIVTMFFASASALWQHLKEAKIRWPYVRPLLVGALPAAVVAALFGNHLQSSTLTHVFGFFTLFLAFGVLGILFEDPYESTMTEEFRGRPRPRESSFCLVVGAVHGLVSGLLGISGGVIACPMQQMALRMPIRDAITNTLVTSAVVTGVASVLVVWSGVDHGDYTTSQIVFVDLFMGTGCAIGAPIGAWVGRRSPVPVLHFVDFLLVFTSGLCILF